MLASNGASDSIFSLPSSCAGTVWLKAEIVVNESTRKKKKSIVILVFKSASVYKDLFFSVFNITIIKNNVMVKYMIKNIITDSKKVLFAIKNQIKAKIISRRNFNDMAIRL